MDDLPAELVCQVLVRCDDASFCALRSTSRRLRWLAPHERRAEARRVLAARILPRPSDVDPRILAPRLDWEGVVRRGRWGPDDKFSAWFPPAGCPDHEAVCAAIARLGPAQASAIHRILEAKSDDLCADEAFNAMMDMHGDELEETDDCALYQRRNSAPYAEGGCRDAVFDGRTSMLPQVALAYAHAILMARGYRCRNPYSNGHTVPVAWFMIDYDLEQDLPALILATGLA